MNRHERRAAEARARAAAVDKGFAGYCAQARRAFPFIRDRDLGEAWMRGQVWSASGADGMVIHKKGEPTVRNATDILVSMTYGSLKFRAVADPDLLHACVAEWERVLELLEPAADRREASRRFILAGLVKQRHDSGRRGQNFRLVLGSADEPLPDRVQSMPPQPINEPADVHPLPPIEDDDAGAA